MIIYVIAALSQFICYFLYLCFWHLTVGIAGSKAAIIAIATTIPFFVIFFLRISQFSIFSYLLKCSVCLPFPVISLKQIILHPFSLKKSWRFTNFYLLSRQFFFNCFHGFFYAIRIYYCNIPVFTSK